MIARRAFTLIETMVVIAVAAVLIVLTAGAIGRVRQSAQRAASLSNLRSHAQVFATYGSDHTGHHPHFTRPGFASTPLSGGGLSIVSASYFDAHHTWHVALADAYYQGNASADSFFSPRDRRAGRPRQASYLYPCVFIADPDFWDETRRVGPEQFRATRADEVQFPAQKVLLVENAQAIMPPQAVAHLAAFSDASALSIPAAAAASGYPRGEGQQFYAAGAVHVSDAPPLLHTFFGVRGRDRF